MTGQLKKRGLLGGILAAAAGLAAGVMGSGRAALASPWTGYTGGGHRAGRYAGNPGRAGDKLARMAAEGRIGKGGVR